MHTHTFPQTFLITGATRGIGRALVTQLCARGGRVYATGRDDKLLDELRRETGCMGMAFDLVGPDITRLYQAACQTLGSPPDALVNNAGFNRCKAPIAESDPADFDTQFAVNLRAPYLLCRAALRDMTTRKRGHILNIISTCALFANENMGIYTAMKCGLRGLTGVLIKEARPFGVKVTGVYPGGTDSSFRAQPRPDYMRPESVASMIVQALYAPADTVIHDLVFRPFVETNF